MEIAISIDGGKTWIEAKQGVRVTVGPLPVFSGCPGEDNEKGDLLFNFTGEGLITDVWADVIVVDVPLQMKTENPGTSSATYTEIAERLVEANS